MRKAKRIIAGVMSALMLLSNCPMDELTAYAAEPESQSATETDAAETVTIYKGGAYAYGGEASNWYSTDEAPDSTNVNAYSVVSEYEMFENSITAEPVSVMDETLVKAVYYSYGAPGSGELCLLNSYSKFTLSFYRENIYIYLRLMYNNARILLDKWIISGMTEVMLYAEIKGIFRYISYQSFITG